MSPATRRTASPTIEQASGTHSDHGSTEDVVAAHVNLTFVLLGDGQVDRAAEVALSGIDEAVRRGVGGSDGALLACNAAEALIGSVVWPRPSSC